MVNAIIFDLGGVLFPIPPYLNKPDLTRFQNIKQLVIDVYKSGNISFGQLKQDIIKKDCSDFSKRELEQIYKSLTVIDKKLLELIAELDDNYQVYGLVNGAPLWTDIRSELFNLNKYFKKIYVSSEIGIEKPDPRIFQYFLTQTGLKAENCVFIDDSEKNCSSAKEIGFRVIQYENSEQLRAVLEELLRK